MRKEDRELIKKLIPKLGSLYKGSIIGEECLGKWEELVNG